MALHELKTWPAYFEAILNGSKKVELRKDDRGSQVGDTLLLREWIPHSDYPATYTGRKVAVTVTHILRDGPWLADGYIAMSIERSDMDERTFSDVKKRVAVFFYAFKLALR